MFRISVKFRVLTKHLLFETRGIRNSVQANAKSNSSRSDVRAQGFGPLQWRNHAFWIRIHKHSRIACIHGGLYRTAPTWRCRHLFWFISFTNLPL